MRTWSSRTALLSKRTVSAYLSAPSALIDSERHLPSSTSVYAARATRPDVEVDCAVLRGKARHCWVSVGPDVAAEEIDAAELATAPSLYDDPPARNLADTDHRLQHLAAESSPFDSPRGIAQPGDLVQSDLEHWLSLSCDLAGPGVERNIQRRLQRPDVVHRQQCIVSKRPPVAGRKVSGKANVDVTSGALDEIDDEGVVEAVAPKLSQLRKYLRQVSKMASGQSGTGEDVMRVMPHEQICGLLTMVWPSAICMCLPEKPGEYLGCPAVDGRARYGGRQDCWHLEGGIASPYDCRLDQSCLPHCLVRRLSGYRGRDAVLDLVPLLRTRATALPMTLSCHAAGEEGERPRWFALCRCYVIGGIWKYAVEIRGT